MKTTDSFSLMTTGSGLPHRALEALHGDGFAVIRGPIPTRELQRFAESYDKVVLEADPSDTKHGSTTTRVDDLVNRGAEFDCIYVHPPLWRPVATFSCSRSS